jgi:hypothetical protein
MHQTNEHHSNEQMKQCIDNCQKCHATCLQMAATHCLERGGKHVEAEHFRLMMDCAEICQTSANFVLRGSTHHAHVCAECADICEDCARSCEAVGDMDECVAACRACAVSCRALASL